MVGLEGVGDLRKGDVEREGVGKEGASFDELVGEEPQGA